MKTRVMAAAALLPLLLVILLVLPGLYTGILLGLLAAVACYEMLWNTGLVKHPRLVSYCAVMAFATAMWSCFGMPYTWAMLGVLLFAAVLFGEMMIAHTNLAFEKVAICFAAGLLLPFFLTSLVRLRQMENGKFYVLIPFVLAFLSDSGAYFAGRFFGRHKLAPIISPKKTVEGAIGGVIGAVVGMLIYCAVLTLFDFRVNYSYALIYGALGSIGAVFGDLCFSVIKRQTGIKDYGNLIPGHGGVLDRFDSMIIVGPLAEVLLLALNVAVR